MAETDDRTGGKTRLVAVHATEVSEIEAAGLGGPKIYEWMGTYFCEADELERWRAARSPNQATDAL